jgi:hydroxymethylpyrimidine/phosphomethylpyrimidine kinase
MPNLAEAEWLAGFPVRTIDQMEHAAKMLANMGARNVLIKGGHGDGAAVRDVLIEADGRSLVFESPRQDTRHTHGTGCVLSTAIACGLAQGKELREAARLAHDFVQHAIRTAPGLGSGDGPLNLSRS